MSRVQVQGLDAVREWRTLAAGMVWLYAGFAGASVFAGVLAAWLSGEHSTAGAWLAALLAGALASYAWRRTMVSIAATGGVTRAPSRGPRSPGGTMAVASAHAARA